MASGLLQRIPTVSSATAPELDEPASTGVGELVATAQAMLTEASSRSPRALSDDALGAAIASLSAVESQAAALRLTLSAVADSRRVAEQTAETGTDAWLARLTATPKDQAAGGLRLAGLLQEKYPATRAAFAAGRLRVEQVRVIVNAAEQAPVEATPEQVAVAEQWLVDRATGDARRDGRPLDARRLRQTARRMFAALDPALARRHEAILLGRETRSAEAETHLMLGDNGDGSYTGRFRIPELHGRILRTMLDHLTAPRRMTRDRAGHATVDEAAPGHAGGHNILERDGAAFCELLEHLPTEGWSGQGANGCDILVRIDLDDLIHGLGAAGLDTDVAITAGEARRLACNAGLIPAVLGGRSEPLDLGRSRRLHSRAQRRALAATHDSCAVSGCDRPFAWCEIHHHRLSWQHGGTTDLDNALPLCGHHHRRAHDTRFDLRRRRDGEWAFHRRT